MAVKENQKKKATGKTAEIKSQLKLRFEIKFELKFEMPKEPEAQEHWDCNESVEETNEFKKFLD